MGRAARPARGARSKRGTGQLQRRGAPRRAALPGPGPAPARVLDFELPAPFNMPERTHDRPSPSRRVVVSRQEIPRGVPGSPRADLAAVGLDLRLNEARLLGGHHAQEEGGSDAEQEGPHV
jgi:hypothetical protein